MAILSPVRLGFAVLAAAVLVGLTGCGGSASGLDGSIDLGTSAGVNVLPGVAADYTGFLANHTSQVVVLKSARLLTLKGFVRPRLAHLAIETGRLFDASGRGWPPRGPSPHLAVFNGARVWRHRRVQILYAVVAPRLGQYGDAGIQVTVLVGGTPVTVNVLSAAGTCIVKSLNFDCSNAFYNRVQNVSSVPGGGVGAVVGKPVR
jgi:hypothetical protein